MLSCFWPARMSHRRVKVVCSGSCLAISGLEPLATGRVRSVYAFPETAGPADQGRHAAELPSMTIRWASRLVRHLFPDTIHRNTLKEIECELMAALKLGEDIPGSPLARCLGVRADGPRPGCCRRAHSPVPDGNLAPASAATQKIWRDERCGAGGSECLCQEAVSICQIVARDIHNKNIVYGHRGGVKAFFLIDGYGERNVRAAALAVPLPERPVPAQAPGPHRPEDPAGLAQRPARIQPALNRCGARRPR